MDHALFDDDFAEASIEAISLAALRPSPPPRPTDEGTFPTASPRALRPRRARSSFAPLPPPARVAPSLSDVHARLPPPPAPPKLSPYPAPWPAALLALPHNALRAELADLARMLAALARPRPLQRMRLVAAWAPPFLSFLGAYLAFEAAVLHPWVFRPAPSPLRPRLASHAALLADLAAELANVLALFRARPTPDVRPVMCRAAAELAESVAQYLDVQARHLPALISQGHSKEEAVNVSRLMARRLDLLLLTRWIPRRKDRAAVWRMCLSPTRWVAVLAKGRRECAEHLAIVAEVCEQQCAAVG